MSMYITSTIPETGQRGTQSDGTVSLVKDYAGPWHDIFTWVQDVRDRHDMDRVEAAIRDAREDFRAQRITPERLSLLLYLGQCQPAVEYRIPTI